MSHRATTWAFAQHLPALQKLVLIVLADRHNNDTNRCDPSMERIAEDCGMSKESAKRSIKELCEKGLISAHQRKEGPVSLTNFYSFNMGGVGSDRPPGRVTQTPGVGSDRPPNLEVEPVIEPGSTLTLTPSDVSVVTKHSSFRSLYEKYFSFKNSIAAPWDAKEAAALSRWLKANPTVTAEQWKGILNNRARSDINNALPLSVWIGRSFTWLHRPQGDWGNGSRANLKQTSAIDNAAAAITAVTGVDHRAVGRDSGDFRRRDNPGTLPPDVGSPNDGES